MRRAKFPESKGRKIKLLITDVDGVLTDGRIILGSKGEEFKNFHVQDGTGIHLGIKAGIKIAIISGRRSAVTRLRAKELGINDVLEVVQRKESAYEKLRKKYGLKHSEIAYIGDDVHDIGVMKKVGLAMTVPGGVPEVKRLADYTTARAGGNGAVREVIDRLLECHGKKVKSLLSYCAVFLVLWLMMTLCGRDEMVTAAVAATQTDRGEKMEGGFLYTVTEGGGVILEIEGERATGLATDTVNIEKPRVKWYSENGTVVIEAEKGFWNKQTNGVHFEGGVSVKGKGWGRMECAQLDWDSDEKKITAKGSVTGVFYLDRYVEKETADQSENRRSDEAQD